VQTSFIDSMCEIKSYRHLLSDQHVLKNIGVRQYYKQLPFRPLPQKAFEQKCATLTDLLSSVDFQQCLVFSNYHLRLVTVICMEHARNARLAIRFVSELPYTCVHT